ncbi:MAG: class II aldolase/adducin family protein [Kofleriaceae bacterium]
MTLRLRDDLVATARRMSELGLTPGTSGNVSVRVPSGMLVTPSGMAYSMLVPDDLVDVRADGHIRPGQRDPSSEWQLHRDLYTARGDCTAIVHTHSRYCTTIACLRKPIPAIHYMIALAGTTEIPCAEYATFGSPELAHNVVSALAEGRAALMANHGMVALGDSLAAALKLAAEIEELAALFWHAMQAGTPVILDREEMTRVAGKFATYGKQRPRKRSW